MIPHFPNFKKLEKDDLTDIKKFSKKYDSYSDFNQTSLWCWNTRNKTLISDLNNNLIIKFTDYISLDQFYSFLGNTEVNETAKTLLEFSKKEEKPRLKLIPEISIKGLDKSIFNIEEDRNNFDYIYNVSDLFNCAGSAFETQRNQISRFNKKYTNVEVKFMKISETMNDILELSGKWKKGKLNKLSEIELNNEEKSITRIFDLSDSDLFSICIYYMDELVGFAIDEILDNKFAICHFAKANVNFSGVYSYLMRKNCEFLISRGIQKLNYEQDLGLPNLRYSKSTFQPSEFLKKFILS